MARRPRRLAARCLLLLALLATHVSFGTAHRTLQRITVIPASDSPEDDSSDGQAPDLEDTAADDTSADSPALRTQPSGSRSSRGSKGIGSSSSEYSTERGTSPPSRQGWTDALYSEDDVPEQEQPPSNIRNAGRFCARQSEPSTEHSAWLAALCCFGLTSVFQALYSPLLRAGMHTGTRSAQACEQSGSLNCRHCLPSR